ncbi:MAG: hypothetical protein ACYS67_03635 [Planctomycetota bacterium]
MTIASELERSIESLTEFVKKAKKYGEDFTFFVAESGGKRLGTAKDLNELTDELQEQEKRLQELDSEIAGGFG